MTPKEQKDLIIGYRKYLFLETDKNSEEIIDTYLATLTPTSERYKATTAFFDKLPDGLREMAKENYDEGFYGFVPIDICCAITYGFDWDNSRQTFGFWDALHNAILEKSPSITINGITYDLTKCYE
jgi:hypothetical protein